jgi:glycosyltransferase involved in cell wall biosynthesis
LNDNNQQLPLPSDANIIQQFIYVASQFPNESILWIEESVADLVNKEDLLIHYKTSRYMVSIGNMNHHFLYPEIGYVTDGPFVSVSQQFKYPTWLMQEKAGIVAASVINQFNGNNYKHKSLEYFLTSVARLGQPQGLFCYHIPLSSQIVKDLHESHLALFQFVVQHYKRVWSFVLFFLLNRYENVFSFSAFAKAQFITKLNTHLELAHTKKLLKNYSEFSYEVIIPTMGRRDYLKDVLLDFSKQTHLPKRIIIVEQNPDVTAVSQLDYISEEKWPFEIDHTFIHQTGACNARNLAISKTTEDWVMLFDDDNRFEKDTFESIFDQINKLKCEVLTTSYLQENEVEKYTTPMQWSTFGSGCSMIHREVLEKCKFDMALEHGYGEDVDYGMQIRNAGYDVFYAPEIEILHLKAPVGGFRKKVEFPWTDQGLQPKPSPQIMYHRKKNTTKEQLIGFKWLLFVNYYKRQTLRNPFAYYKRFKKMWSLSLNYSNNL